jgi:phosphomannomutase
MSVFKAYDIRGTWPDGIDAALSHRTGRAYADFIGKGPIAVGRDMRTMAPEAQGAFMDGIRDGGLDVLDVGLCSTPQLYFAVGHLGAAGGVAVTASHNPAGYIGFKLCREEAIPISADTGILDIESMATDPDAPAPLATRGGLEQVETLADYTAHVLKWAGLEREIVLASDAANGMAAHTFPSILGGLDKVSHHGLYFELDGNFPNHEANPLKASNLVDLQRLVGDTGAALGAAFDGDADRCCFLDEKGRPLGNDVVTALVARDVLAGESGAAIVYDLRSSWALPQIIEECGGKPVRERVGHSFLKARMREHDAPFGGELSGHYYFRDNWYADNSEIILLAVMGLLSRSSKPFSEMADDVMRYPSTGEVNFRVEDKAGAIQKLQDAFPQGEADFLDGITLSFGGLDEPSWWWVNLRPSNTEPYLRMNLEAENRPLMEEKLAEVVSILGVEPLP